MLRPPDHISHSARETLQRCAKSYFLSRMAGAPKRPALWLAGGSAVHETTEQWDERFAAFGQDPEWTPKDTSLAWNLFFDLQLAKASAAEPNVNMWRSARAEPIEVWRSMGLQLVQAYIDWRQRSPWEIWTTPDGEPAIELDVSGMLPGCPVEIKAYLDRVFYDPGLAGLRLWIVDLKTGKRAPKNADQFGTYGALLKQKYGVEAVLGVPFMNRTGTPGKVFDLTEYTPEFVGEMYGKAWEQIQSGVFTADTSDCFLCDVQAACAAQSGPLAHLYDPDSPGYPPPF